MAGDLEESEAWAQRAARAQAAAAQAYARLVHLAESHDSGQVRRVAQFLASTYDGTTFPLDPFELRCVDIAISDDMLTCLDALRWGKADLFKLIPDGERRVQAICAAWGLHWPQA
jgi:hypothetical protein